LKKTTKRVCIYSAHSIVALPLLNIYIKYLGYPIWFTNDQRTIFYKETISELERSVNIHSQRQLSVYGRAHLANTLILSKLWHFCKLQVFQKAFTTKCLLLCINS
jgi:hypothetical protein